MNEFVTIYSTELMRRLRSRLFLFGLLLGALFIFALVKIPQIIQSSVTNSNKIVVMGDPRLTTRAVPLLRKDFTISGVTASPNRPSPALLKRLQAKAAVALSAQGKRLHVVVYSTDPGTLDVATIRRDLVPLSLALATGLGGNRVAGLLHLPIDVVTVASKFGSASASDSAHAIAYLLLLLLYLLIMINSQLIMSAVAEEKTSRIAELLIASVSPTSLLAGKILASMTLALVQLAIWLLVTFVAGSSLAQQAGASASNNPLAFSLSDVSQAELAGFFVFFVLAFLQLSTLFAAAASLVNRTEDLGSIAGPLIVPVVFAFFVAMAALAMPDASWIVAASLVPILSPFVMFTRMVVTAVPAWQIALAIAVNIAATVGIAMLGGKLYRLGLLLYGRPPKFTQIVRALTQS